MLPSDTINREHMMLQALWYVTKNQRHKLLSPGTCRPAEPTSLMEVLSPPLYCACFTTTLQVASFPIPFYSGGRDTGLKLVSGGPGIRIHIFPDCKAHVFTQASSNALEVHKIPHIQCWWSSGARMREAQGKQQAFWPGVAGKAFQGKVTQRRHRKIALLQSEQ